MTRPMESRTDRAAECRYFARFFSTEPDAPLVDAFHSELESKSYSSFDLQPLRTEFTRLFLLNVFPYASIYLDDEALLNTETTARVESIYAKAGFEPDPSLQFGAADHFALELLFTSFLYEAGQEWRANDFIWREILPWAFVFLFAVEKNSQGAFYRLAAQETNRWLASIAQPIDGGRIKPPRSSPGDEDDLDSIVSHLLTPALSGIWLSKQDISALGRELALPLGFGDRALMLKSLFRTAGDYDRIENLLTALVGDVDLWLRRYTQEVQTYDHVAPVLALWSGRAQITRGRLLKMLQTVRTGP